MIEQDEFKIVKDIFKGLQRKYSLVPIGVEEKIEYLSLIKNSIFMFDYKFVELNQAYHFTTQDNQDAIITLALFADFDLSESDENDNFEIQLIAIRKFGKNFGHIIIRPESFADKIYELFHSDEIDFPGNPKFSSNYYLLSDSKLMYQAFTTKNRLSEIEKYNDLIIEIKENVMFARFYNNLANRDGINLIELMKSI